MSDVGSSAGGSPSAVQPGYTAVDLATWSGGHWDPGPPQSVGAIMNDSRKLASGALYVALTGAQFDGHAFVASAAGQGACGAIVHADWPRGSIAGDFPLLRVAHAEEALRALAVGYRQKLAPQIIGITGSAGKTTVKTLTASVLATAHATSSSLGNWNNHIGLPLSLLAMDAKTRMGVFEIGTSHPGEIGPLAAILKPQWAIVTNIGAGHIEFFHSVEAIAEEKADLLRALPADGLAFLNRDGEWYGMLRRASPAPVVTISTRSDADYRLHARGVANDAIDVEETATGERFRFALGVGGEAQAANALFAIAVARRAGMSPAAIAGALRGSPALPMRWQRETVHGLHVVNDAYNANPLSMRAALAAFHEEGIPGRKWLVLGGMLELGAHAELEHVALGRDVAAGEWAGLIVVGKLGEWIARGAEDAGWAPARICRCDSTDAAARALAERAQAGDGVLLKASRGARLEAILKHGIGPQGAAPAV